MPSNAIVAGVGAAATDLFQLHRLCEVRHLVQAAALRRRAHNYWKDLAESAHQDADDAVTQASSAYAQLCAVLPTQAAATSRPLSRCLPLPKVRLTADGIDLLTRCYRQDHCWPDPGGEALKSLSAANPGVYEGWSSCSRNWRGSVCDPGLASGADSASSGSQTLSPTPTNPRTVLVSSVPVAKKLLTGNEGLAKGASERKQKGTATILDGCRHLVVGSGLANAT